MVSCKVGDWFPGYGASSHQIEVFPDITLLIDAGHGFNTLGKGSPDGCFKEWEFNRKVARLIVNALQKRGIKAMMLVPEDMDISLGERCRRANAFDKNKTLLVSIHANAAGNGSKWMNAKGWSIYTTKGITKADTLAQFIWDEASREFTDRTVRKYSNADLGADYEENFYILMHTYCPAVLSENFFYDNKEECEWLLTEEAVYRCAVVHINGIINYMKNL